MIDRKCIDCKHFKIRQGRTKTRYLCQAMRTVEHYANGNSLTVLGETMPLSPVCGRFRGVAEPMLPEFAKA